MRSRHRTTGVLCGLAALMSVPLRVLVYSSRLEYHLLPALSTLTSIIGLGGDAEIRGEAIASEKPTALPPIRAVWIRPPRDLAEIPVVMDRVRKARFNVAFVETFYHGFTIYPSQVFPQRPEFQGRDPLSLFIEEGRSRGIAVHPWLEMLYWRPSQQHNLPQTPVLDKHPEWAELRYGETIRTVSRNQGTMVSPALPEVREKLAALVHELTRHYDIAGLNLDYIRYQSPAGYNPRSAALFKKETGQDPPPPADLSSPVRKEWVRFKERQVSRLVSEVTEAFRAEMLRKGKTGLVSASVFPDYYRKWPSDGKGQDWAAWIEHRYVDFLTPMIYATSMRGKSEDLAEVRRKLGDLRRVVPGTVVNPGSVHPEVTKQLDWLRRESGLPGYAIFQYSFLASQPKLFEQIGKSLETWGR